MDGESIWMAGGVILGFTAFCRAHLASGISPQWTAEGTVYVPQYFSGGPIEMQMFLLGSWEGDLTKTHLLATTVDGARLRDHREVRTRWGWRDLKRDPVHQVLMQEVLVRLRLAQCNIPTAPPWPGEGTKDKAEKDSRHQNHPSCPTIFSWTGRIFAGSHFFLRTNSHQFQEQKFRITAFLSNVYLTFQWLTCPLLTLIRNQTEWNTWLWHIVVILKDFSTPAPKTQNQSSKRLLTWPSHHLVGTRKG